MRLIDYNGAFKAILKQFAVMTEAVDKWARSTEGNLAQRQRNMVTQLDELYSV